MFSLTRSLVSRDRSRFQENGFDLDLSYITPRIIAMGFPAQGVKSAWRNHVDDVVRFLELYHKENYLIFNLSEHTYDYSLFHDQVVEFQFPDHHSPHLELLFCVAQSIDSWLESDEEHVAVIHCLAGRGRTGTIIAAYFLYSGLFNDAESALFAFAARRSLKDKGVAVPSQRRYVAYYQRLLHENLDVHHPPRIVLAAIEFFPNVFNQGYDVAGRTLQVLVFRPPERSHPIYSKEQSVYSEGGSPNFFLCMQVPIVADVLLVFKIQGAPDFRFAFHTTFVSDLVYLDAQSTELDCGTHNLRYHTPFVMRLHFSCNHPTLPSPAEPITSALSTPPPIVTPFIESSPKQARSPALSSRQDKATKDTAESPSEWDLPSVKQLSAASSSLVFSSYPPSPFRPKPPPVLQDHPLQQQPLFPLRKHRFLSTKPLSVTSFPPSRRQICAKPPQQPLLQQLREETSFTTSPGARIVQHHNHSKWTG